MNCNCSTTTTAPPTPPQPPPPPLLPERSERAEELVDNLAALSDLSPEASAAPASEPEQPHDEEPDRASCRPDREGKGDDAATETNVTSPRQGIMFVAVSSVQGSGSPPIPNGTPGATRNGDPWPAPGFPRQSPKRSDRWVLSPSTTTRSNMKIIALVSTRNSGREKVFAPQVWLFIALMSKLIPRCFVRDLRLGVDVRRPGAIYSDAVVLCAYQPRRTCSQWRSSWMRGGAGVCCIRCRLMYAARTVLGKGVVKCFFDS